MNLLCGDLSFPNMIFAECLFVGSLTVRPDIVAMIIFGNDKDPQSKFIYTDLATGHRYSGANRPAWQNKSGNKHNNDPYFETDPVSFPGYTYDFGKSEYKGQDPSEGGRVQAKPGIYKHVALLDIASMHPSSIENLNLFGTEYTKNFSKIKQARILIKHKQFDEVRRMFEGTLDIYLTDESVAILCPLRWSQTLMFLLTIHRVIITVVKIKPHLHLE